jgi:S-adenosylmethionine synthetase
MIRIQSRPGKTVPRLSLEIVERKGRGHPDFICDAISEAISVALCRVCSHQTGSILHHNIDKGLLARQIFTTVEGVAEVYVLMLSRIGKPVDQPRMVGVSLNLKRGCRLRDVKKTITEAVEAQLDRIGSFCDDLARGKYPVC